MSQELSTSTTLRRDGTWRSAGDAPDTPGKGDVLALLSTVDRPTKGGCVVVRLVLDGASSDDPRKVRDRLQDEDAVVATGAGRDGAAGGADTVDVLVEPGYDVATVGKALSDVGEVEAVSAATFDVAATAQRTAGKGADSTDGTAGSPDGTAEPAGAADPTDEDLEPSGTALRSGQSGNVDQAVVDEVFATLREQVDPVPYDSLVDELDEQPLAGADVDLTSLFEEDTSGTPSTGDGPLDGDCSDGSNEPVRPDGPGQSTEGALSGRPAGERGPVETDGRGDGGARTADAADRHPAEWMAARLDAIERRVSALEDRLEEPHDGSNPRNERGIVDPKAAPGTPTPAARPDRPAPDRDSIPERLAALEETLEGLAEQHRRLRNALLDEGE